MKPTKFTKLIQIKFVAHWQLAIKRRVHLFVADQKLYIEVYVHNSIYITRGRLLSEKLAYDLARLGRDF
jgi:hypothetical protein